MEAGKQTHGFEDSGSMWAVGTEVEVRTEFIDGQQWQSANDQWRGVVMTHPHASPDPQTYNVMPHEPRGAEGYVSMHPRLLLPGVVTVELPAGNMVELRKSIVPLAREA